jgi:diaminohydroxyphosphoribosylaminopyrimidine deaminase/5-amino-6-(5-phosphoribosylamino)uracil reductase
MQGEQERYMQRCLQLAQQGETSTSPNPMVGSVIVHQGKIIGEGWHYQAGEAHAEVNAIANVKQKDLLQDSTLYVNLEPCSHQGRTPPCSDLIIEKQIPRVIIGCRDKNSLVNGKGIAKLQSAGIEVIKDILVEKCQFINRRFFTFHSKQRPYILLKWAQSSDGFMDINRSVKEKGVHWISQPETRPFVHRERATVDAILVGANTVINDDPHLGISEYNSAKKPWRLILAPKGRVNAQAQVFRDEHFLYFSEERRAFETQVLNPARPLESLLKTLHQKNIQSIMVEGGAYTLQKFIDAKLWDEALIITGTSNLGNGLAAPKLAGKLAEDYYLKQDLIQRVFTL